MRSEHVRSVELRQNQLETLERAIARRAETDAALSVHELVLNGDIEGLVQAAGAMKNDPKVAAILEEIEGHRDAFVGEFPRVVSGNGPVHVAPWLFSFEKASSRVCSVVGPGVQGTGFLIGKNVILTAYHVVAALFVDKSLAADVRLIFDLQRTREEDTLTLATEYKLRMDEPVAADYSPSDLDYAILNVDGTPSEDVVGGVKRAWVNLPDIDRATPEGMFIGVVHRPEIDTLYFSPGSVVGRDSVSQRLIYNANTGAGTSGSPVFDSQWRLIAVHQNSDEEILPRTTRGTPAALIRQHIRQLPLSRSPIDIFRGDLF